MTLPILPPTINDSSIEGSLASHFVERAKAQEESFAKTVAEDELYSMVLIMPDGSIISVENLGYEDPDMVVVEGVNEGNQKLRLLIQMFGLNLILVKYKKNPEYPEESMSNKIVGYQLHRKDNSKTINRNMNFENYQYTVTERFIRYAKIDTQSDPNSPTCPSTMKQKDLGKLLVDELIALGVKDAAMDEHGYVYATVPGNTSKHVDTICFCSHMDTSPDCSGQNVNPVIHANYNGQDLVLPNDKTQVIRFAEHPALAEQIGNDIITTDGTTLLGADNKAGVAEIMDAVNYLMTHPEVKHGDIRILFTPDEEIGRGADKVDMKKLNAKFGYTMDGETIGHIENETFSADGVSIKIYGFPTHPGFAKDKMQHAIKIAAEIVNRIPKNKTPETTEKKEPFMHPVAINGGLESVEIKWIIRAFDTPTLHALELELEEITKAVLSGYNKCSYEFKVTEQYRNMKEVLDTCAHVVDYAVEAVKRTGVKPVLSSIRGGTDGSRLSFMGLPCPNIYAGEHAFHSKQEWVSVQDMQKATQTIVHLAAIWEEKA